MVFTISIKACFDRGGFLLCKNLDLYWLLSELKSPHDLPLWLQIHRQSYAGHDNLKVDLQVVPIINDQWHLYSRKSTSLKNLEKF